MKNLTLVMMLIASLIFINSCKNKPAKTAEKEEGIKTELFGVMPDGDSIYQYTLTSAAGITVKIINYGGIVTEILAPDKEGNIENIILGFDNLEQYLEPHPYFGVLVGRYANRIANAEFELDGQKYTLAKNDGENTLHGGVKGFDKVVWDAEPVTNDTAQALILTYHSADMEEGYPGNLDVQVSYTLSGNDLIMWYQATTDKATPVNLTNHCYFNLSQDGTILDHVLTIKASGFTPVNDVLIPTGEIAPVEGTPFDFREPHAIGERIETVPGADPGGYDHNWVLDRTGDDLENIALLEDPNSGRTLEVLTTEPGLQFYSGNFLDGTITSGDKTYEKHYGLCLETQHFPDSPNQPDFPNTILQPGEKYSTVTIYRFGTTEE